jgi:hypothetical protein
VDHFSGALHHEYSLQEYTPYSKKMAAPKRQLYEIFARTGAAHKSISSKCPSPSVGSYDANVNSGWLTRNSVEVIFVHGVTEIHDRLHRQTIPPLTFVDATKRAPKVISRCPQQSFMK